MSIATSVCPHCHGDGYLWDPTACGDPDHCSPTYDCGVCDGTGKVTIETTPTPLGAISADLNRHHNKNGPQA